MNRIPEYQQIRVAEDAAIAIDALRAICEVGRAGQMHPRYFAEKYKTVKSCMDFITSIAEEYGITEE